MATAQVYVCDAVTPAVRSLHPHPTTCTARSRAASTDRVLRQFDHRPGTEKLFHVGQIGPTCSRELLYAEIEKCDVVCANCHFERTHQRDQYFGRQPTDEAI